jgi:hypothetical protein
MAKTLDGLRRLIKTSLHGRRLGLDDSGALSGAKQFRRPATAATSATTGTALPNYGVVTIDSTTGDTYTLTDPYLNAEVTIRCISTGGAQTITPAAATIQSSASSTGGTITLTGAGAITLFGQTTALWVPTSRFGTSAVAHVNT